jgi:hypothetical protein
MAVLAIVGFCGMAYAAKDKAPKAPAEKPLVGELTKNVGAAADGTGTLTVKPGKKDAADVTVNYNKDTKVSVDGTAGKAITDLAVGMKVSITPATGMAADIKATAAKAPKAPKAPKAAK